MYVGLVGVGVSNTLHKSFNLRNSVILSNLLVAYVQQFSTVLSIENPKYTTINTKVLQEMMLSVPVPARCICFLSIILFSQLCSLPLCASYVPTYVLVLL